VAPSRDDDPNTSKGEINARIHGGGEFFQGRDQAQGGDGNTHLDEEKECNAEIWVLDTEATIRVSGGIHEAQYGGAQHHAFWR
jgi:hypothetical protein